MPPCPSRGGGRRGGTAFGTSSSSKGDTDLTLRTALISGLKLFGEKYDYELSTKRNKCERLVRLYKECKTDRLSNCDFYLELRPEGCPDFNKEEFLETLRVSNLKGMSFGTSSSSRGDYDWFETAVISFFKLFGENYDYELLKKRKECERLVGLYKECETNKLSDCDYHLERRPEGCSDFNKEEFLQTLRAPNLKSNGTSFGTSSSSREDYDWFETAVISFFKLFGENYDYELLKKRKECERLVGLYKECKTNKLSNCDLYLEQRPEGCPDFNKVEFLQTLRAPNPKSNGTSFGTSSSSREDYDWFETAVISFFKLFGENYDYELLKKRKECERLVGLYKEGPEGCPDFNKEEFLQTLRASNQKSNDKNEEQLGDQSR
ncbi:hypothetical protein LOK49_LG09G00197 [Camellia lanceoleosa]|uniref:Uncharacterized protein n=1 Tax=Camellia lanceoleosa TaxID=1840588 RepID=A0ACC0GJV7_9ERIC|nr:hypothetical protein LOK49_LG09G00197 [Camellia lanceoleosa]